MNTKLQFFRKLCAYYLLLSFLLLTGSAIASTNNKNFNEILIKLSVRNANLADVFSEIESKTEFTFVFDETVTKSKEKFNFMGKKQRLSTILGLISSRTGLKFQQINKTISVLKAIPQQKIWGKVLDDEKLPLPGATIIEKGTSNGVTTDFDGNFSISISSYPTILEVSFMGFKTQEITATSTDEPLEIILQENANALNEVVVTALGIKREEKQLGFSQATVDGESLSQTAPTNWSSGLKGKVAGMNISSSGSGPINSQQITLRGNSSFDLNGNYALIVVDGVPINTEMTTSGSGSAYMGEDSPIDYGNGISNLNFDDIESVSVLKGPGAAALYGSRAANGVLMITTKSGKKSKGLGITINSITSFDRIQRWPDYQYRYGQGNNYTNADGELYYSYGSSEDGGSTGGTSSAWGPEFNDQEFFQYDPSVQGQSLERQEWRPYKDNRKDFWQTGVNTQNNIAIQGGGKDGSMRASLAHTKNEWIMPNTGYERVTASLNSKYNISEKISLGAVVNYNNQWSDNLPSTGYNNGSIAYFMIFQNPNVDLDWYRPIWQEGQENIQQIQPFSSYIDNPYLIAYKSLNTLNSHQIVGNLNANIKLAPHFNLMLRTAINTYNQEREQKRPYSINRYAEGYYQTQDVFKQEINNDFLLSYENKFKDFNLSASIGGNNRIEKRRLNNASVTGLVVPDVYKLSNGKNAPSLYTSDQNKEVNSLYGLMTWSYKDQIFLDITGRNDWSSTLPKENWSFFYPSANTSFILSDIFNFSGKGIEYLKYRFSYAQVGNDTSPYQTRKYYSQNNFPSSATVPTTLYNRDFKPEISTSYETGFEARFLNNRISLDATVYQISTENQIIAVPLNWDTGYSSAILNAGKVRNRGIELTLTGKIINNDKLKWSSTLTWSKNEGEVFNLPDNIENQYIIDQGGQASLIAKVGGSPTAIYGYKFVRSPEGQIVYDSKGLPAYPESGDIRYVGDAMPDWRAGLYNQITLGNFDFSFTLDGQYGGIIYSQTHHKLTQQGKLKFTYEGRDNMSIVGDGVVLNADGSYSPNTTEVAVQEWYNRYYRRANVESNSFEASYLKLREINLQYRFPAKWLNNTGIQSLSLSAFGRNVAMLTDFPIYDPETAALNGNRIMPGVEIGQMPSPATYGVNLKLSL